MIPNLFSKQPIPHRLPLELEKIVRVCRRQSKKACLRTAFFFVVRHNRFSRWQFIFRPDRLFRTDVTYLVRAHDAVPCTAMNYLLRIVLVKSGHFTEEDITPKITNTWFIVIHQYLDVRISRTEHVFLDPWSYQFGIDLGNYANGFASRSFSPIR